MLPPNDKLTICFAHVAYQLHERFSALDTGINSFAARDPETLEDRVGEADVLVISGLWQEGLLDRAGKLRFIQSIGAGTDHFGFLYQGDLEAFCAELRAKGVAFPVELKRGVNGSLLCYVAAPDGVSIELMQC